MTDYRQVRLEYIIFSLLEHEKQNLLINICLPLYLVHQKLLLRFSLCHPELVTSENYIGKK